MFSEEEIKPHRAQVTCPRSHCYLVANSSLQTQITHFGSWLELNSELEEEPISLAAVRSAPGPGSRPPGPAIPNKFTCLQGQSEQGTSYLPAVLIRYCLHDQGSSGRGEEAPASQEENFAAPFSTYSRIAARAFIGEGGSEQPSSLSLALSLSLTHAYST